MKIVPNVVGPGCLNLLMIAPNIEYCYVSELIQ